MARLALDRTQVLGHRRRAGGLEVRRPAGGDAVRRAAWAGLQDSVPRAAVLSLHARVEETVPTAWQDPALVQVWGPRYNVYAVAAEDRAVFTLGRLPTGRRQLARAEEAATALDGLLDGRELTYGDAGRALGRNPNALRYGTTTGRVLVRWDGARLPTVRTVSAPDLDPDEARRELARRHLHVLGPGTAESFRRWAGVTAREARAVVASLDDELLPVTTPIGEAVALASDEGSLTAGPGPAPPARLLPSGDAYWLLWGDDRDLLVPDPARRDTLWTPRVWPGALLVDGEVCGTWRRARHEVAVEAWRDLTRAERNAVEAEAAGLPLPDLDRDVEVTWAA